MFSFIETKLFSRLLGDYLTDDEYSRLQGALIEARNAARWCRDRAAFESFVGLSRVAESAAAFGSSTTPERVKASSGC